MSMPYGVICPKLFNAIGAVLSQVKQGKERVLAYYSKALNKPELDYCITRRESLAVVRSIDHYL